MNPAPPEKARKMRGRGMRNKNSETAGETIIKK